MPEQSDPRRRWLALVLVCLGTLMIVLDGTIVNVALPTIQKELGFSESSLAWVVNAYLLTFGGFLLLSGRAADLLGSRRVLVTGVALFTAASLACGLSGSQGLLVTARAVQGIGGSIIMSVSLTMIVNLFPEPGERAKAMSVWGFVASGGSSLGVVAGGVLTQTLSWHWIFLLNVPIGIVSVLLAKPLLPYVPGLGLHEGLDLGGAITVTAAPVLAVFAIVQADAVGWASARTLGLLGAAAVLVVAFVAIEARVAAPLLPLRIFRSRSVVSALAVLAPMTMAFFGWFFFGALYMQRVLAFSSLQTGLGFLPATLLMGALSLGLATWLVNRFGAKRPLLVGLLLMAVGLVLFARAPLGGSFLADLLLPMVLLGAGAGVCFMPLLLLAVEDAAPDVSGAVSGLVSTAQMIGGAVGLAVLASVALARTQGLVAGGAAEVAALHGGYRMAFLVSAVLAAVALAVGALALKPAANTQQPQENLALVA